MKSVLPIIRSALALAAMLSACNPTGVNPPPIPTDSVVLAPPAKSEKTNQPSEFELIEFNQKQNLFTLLIPAGWRVNEEESFATITAPDETTIILAAVENTGFPLDKAAFTEYIRNTEKNNFSHLKDYLEEETKLNDPAGIAMVRSQFRLGNELQKLSTIYIRKDKVIITMRLQARQNGFVQMERLFEQVVKSAQFEPSEALKLIPYNIGYDFFSQLNLFKIIVPSAWHYVRKNSIDNIIQDCFTSPDNMAWIENLTFDDGSSINRGQGDQLALRLLAELYAKDIRISSIQTQPDGSIRWTWSSVKNNLEGTTFYEARATSFLILSLFVKSEFQATYARLFDAIIQSYSPLH